jgi:hypothetical protein
MKSLNNPILNKRLSENAHLPFDKPFDRPRPVKFSLRETAKPI